MMDVSRLRWMHEPERFTIAADKITLITEPSTDFWQRTYYGFQNDNAPALVQEINFDFSFTVKTSFATKKQFDQCGICLYQNSDNWFKASVEYENEHIARLGSVVTNKGYSDWATTDIAATTQTMWYRLSRRGQDFLIENASDGLDFNQMRIFHMHEPIQTAYVGFYACSPQESSFEAVFTHFSITESLWPTHAI